VEGTRAVQADEQRPTRFESGGPVAFEIAAKFIGYLPRPVPEWPAVVVENDPSVRAEETSPRGEIAIDPNERPVDGWNG